MKTSLIALLTLGSLASAQPTAATLQLTAPVGASVQLETINTQKMKLKSVEVKPEAGTSLSPQEINQIKNSLEQGFGSVPTQASTQGKVFFRVAERNNTQTTLLATVIQNIAGQDKPITLRITQVFDSSYKPIRWNIESDNEQVNAMFAGLSSEKLQEMLKTNDGGATQFYGQPLVIGQAQESEAELNMQDMLASMLGGLFGQSAELRELMDSLKLEPVRSKSVNTYLGTNAQGWHQFKSTMSMSPLVFNLGDGQNMPKMTMQAKLVSSEGLSSYLPNGLPAQGIQQTKQEMTMSMSMEGVHVKFVMETETQQEMKLK